MWVLSVCALSLAEGKMGTPCRSGSDCAVINVQRDIRQYTEQARKAAAEARDAVRMSRATSVAREAAQRALRELTKSHFQASTALLAKKNAEAAVRKVKYLAEAGTENIYDARERSETHLVSMSLAAVRAADEATEAGVAAAAARAAARSPETADASDADRAQRSGEVRLITRMAQEAEDALAIANEDERQPAGSLLSIISIFTSTAQTAN